MNNKKENCVKNPVIICFTAFFTAVVILMLSTWAANVYPFGEKSWLVWDMHIQYVDYFQYLKNILDGTAKIGYSFSKSLGGSLMGVFAYYLSSPLDMLIVFFSDSQIPLFIYVISSLKVGFCAITAAIFFMYHFKGMKTPEYVILACGFALTQYNISQISNIMWLDGVIMLPLLLIGVDMLLKKKKSLMLYLCIMCCIIFNWYTAYMNCLFIAVYFLYQYLLQERDGKQHKAIEFLKILLRFGSTAILGVLSSMFFFLPTIISLAGGKSVFDLSVFQLYRNHKFFTVLQGMTLGSTPISKEIPSFYCGLLLALFAVYYFFSKKIELRKKVISGVFLLFMIGTCYISVLENIFNGMRFAYTYEYRFAYLPAFFILYLAACGLQAYDMQEKKRMAMVCIGFPAALFLLNVFMKFPEQKYLYLSIGFLFVYGVFLFIGRRGMIWCISLILCMELLANSTFILKQTSGSGGDMDEYFAYLKDANAQQKVLKEYDDSPFYRIEQTSGRGAELTKEGRLHAYYSESMAYDYRGISQYSSSYDAKVSEFIAHLGYSDWIDVTVYDEPILASDSLLGVKYVLSDFDIPLYEKIEELGTYNGKAVYENPYALSAGYKVSEEILNEIDEENPFLYQNRLFSAILGRDVELYKPIEAEARLNTGESEYKTKELQQRGLVYGYARTDIDPLHLYIDGTMRCDYSTWLSYLVFNVGDTSEDHTVTFHNDIEMETDVNPVFYYLDLDLFEEVYQELKAASIKVQEFDDGYVTFDYQSEEDGYLMLSIPMDKNWKIEIDGVETEALSGDDVLTVLELSKGSHQVTMKYNLAGVYEGIVVSLAAVIIFVIWRGIERKQKQKRKVQ